MSEPDQGAAAGTANARPESASLFIVKRRLPKISEHQLAVLPGGPDQRRHPVHRPR